MTANSPTARIKLKRQTVLAGLAGTIAAPHIALGQSGNLIRIGVPTKTYWPTIIAETAIRQKLFEKEGVKAELTIYRSGAEGFEALAAGAADLILNSSSSVAAGLKRGVNARCVANGANGYYRLAIGCEDELADHQGPGDRRQEGRHHRGGIGHRYPRTVDDR